MSQDFKVGDKVRIWKPGYAEHGAFGIATEVIPREARSVYPPGQDIECDRWTWSDGEGGFRAMCGDYMVCHESYWQASKYGDKICGAYVCDKPAEFKARGLVHVGPGGLRIPVYFCEEHKP